MSNGTPAPLGNHREELFGAEPGSDYVLHWDAFCENSRNYRDMHRDKFLAGYNLLEEHGLRKVGRPSVTEIELGQSLKDNWHLVVNWLQGLSMLKDAGIKGTFLPD
jgi:hypothetical protein